MSVTRSVELDRKRVRFSGRCQELTTAPYLTETLRLCPLSGHSSLLLLWRGGSRPGDGASPHTGMGLAPTWAANTDECTTDGHDSVGSSGERPRIAGRRRQEGSGHHALVLRHHGRRAGWRARFGCGNAARAGTL